ncbi:MAG: cellulase family glycosylhydrolase [Phycisphaerae bacterium]|nr:cellulase family glycosylhydrolase [Phycisphaerae bacterium]
MRSRLVDFLTARATRHVLVYALAACVPQPAFGGEADTPIDPIDDVAAWSVNKDGGQRITFRLDPSDCHTPPAAMRVRFEGTQWGNLLRAVALPPEATAMTFWAKVHQAESLAAMYVWLMEADGDGHLARVMLDDRDTPRWPKEWARVRVPLGRFKYDPRGDGKRDLLSVNRMLLGFNYAPQEVSVDDFAWELRKGVAPMPLPKSESFQVASGQAGRVAILDESGLSAPRVATSAQRLAEILGGAGFGVTRIRAGDLADAQRLSRSNFDLLVMPQGPRFPLEAKDAVKRFLQAGGSLLTGGGYAFDEPVVFDGKGWQPAGTVETARELQARQVSDTWINTRYGRPGDAMGFEKTQIGMFDPSYQFERVARAEIAGQKLTAPLEGYVACITDPTGSPVYGKAHLRFIPLGETFDRLGRPRGPLGGLAHHFAGPYAGSSWAFFGVENRDLFAPDALPPALITTLAKRLVDQVYLYGLTTDLACYRDGEGVKIRVSVAHRGRSTASGQLRITIDDALIREQSLQIAPDEGKSKPIEATWKPGAFGKDYYVVRATLTLPYHTDVAENAFCAWKDSVVQKGPKIDLKDNAFRVNGRPAYLTGTNQTGRMWLAEYEDPLVWAKDFAGMRDQGMTLWRILHFSAVMDRSDPLALAKEIPEKVVRETDAIVQLAQKHGVAVFLTLHDWMPVELSDEQLAAQAKWNAFWAGRYKDVPGMLYDVQNEPSVGLPDWPHVRAEWERMLTERYGGIAAAAKRWGVDPSDPSVLAAQAAGRKWTDLKAVDVEHFRVHMLNRWIKANVEPIHRADPDALATVGFLQGMRPADKVLGAKYVDFANMHSYLPLRSFPVDFKILDRRVVGKTLTLGEFGQREAHDARTFGQTGDLPIESIQRYMVYNHYVLGMGGAFTASWCWRDMPDCIFPWGMVRPDHLPKPVMLAYRNFTLLTRFMEPRYEPPVVWLILPDANRLGGRWHEINDAVSRTIDALLGLRVDYGVLREEDVAGLPQTKPLVLIWPMPYCPNDATVAAVRKHVEAGGSLYVSGDVAFDDARKPTKTARLAELGLQQVTHVPPLPVKQQGEVRQTRLGAGEITFVPWPVELTTPEAVRSGLKSFLDTARAPRIPIEPEHPDLHAFTRKSADGTIVHSAVNHGQARAITITTTSGPIRLSLGAPGYGLVAVSKDRQLTLLQAQGPVQRGDKPMIDTDTDVVLVSMDARDVAESAQLLLMPSQPGSVAVHTQRQWGQPVATVGDVIGGEFRALESLPVSVMDGRFKLNVDADRALCLILITEKGDARRRGACLVEKLTLSRR